MREATHRCAAREHAARMLEEVRAGLSARPKTLPSKYFYDARGSRLFDEITRLPEYYLTRAERTLLEEWIPAWVAELRPRSLVELGAGSAEKTRIILSAMTRLGTAELYVPVDMSGAFLHEIAARLRDDYPTLAIAPLVADLTRPFELPADLPGPTLFAFLGSTIGNFEGDDAVRLLRRVRSAMSPGDRFLLGVDLKKDPGVLEAAYNDSRGVTAQFNRNILRVLNRELGADFDPQGFEHRAFYAAARARIEMHLVASRDQEVRIPGIGAIRFREGETIRTEVSCKYDRARVEDLFRGAGLSLHEWVPDRQGWFALAGGAPAGEA